MSRLSRLVCARSLHLSVLTVAVFVGCPLLAQQAASTSPEGGAIEKKTIEMDSFSVTTEVAEGSGLGLQAARKNSAAISDSISGDAFERLAVSNAAEAMTKVTGASLVDGKYVMIRGLGDRYSNTLLNGAAIPTADPEKRAVQLDQFPAGLIESIVTTKSFTPDQPGAFSGGSVNLKTKAFPPQFFVSVSTSLEYRDGTTGEDFLTLPGGKKDRFAMGAETRSAPSLSIGLPDRTAASIAARSGNFTLAEELDRASKLFDNRGYFPKTKTAGPDLGVSIALGDQIPVGKGDGLFGYTASVTFDRDFDHFAGGEQNRFEGIVTAPQIKLAITPDRTQLTYRNAKLPAGTPPLGVDKSVETISWSVFAKLAFRPSQEQEFSLDLLHNQAADDTVQRGVGEQQRDYPGNVYEVYDLLYTERKVSSVQLNGKNRFPGWGDTQLETRLSYSKSTQDQPDYRTLAAYYDLDGAPVNATGVQPNRFFRELAEDSTEVAADLTRPFSFLKRDARFKTGFTWLEGKRDYSEQRFQWSNRPQSRATLESFPGPIGIVDRTSSSVTFGNTIARLQEPNNYDASQTIAAAYVMVDLPVTERVRTITGLRLETTEMETKPVRIPGLNPRDGVVDSDDLLPAFSLVYSPTPRTNWRAAYGKTIARPTFKELTDVRYEDVFTLDTYLGNPLLVRTVVDNVDLRWEWFPRRGQVFAASLFYKRLKDPIEVVFTPASGSIQPQNVDRGTVYGVEVEMSRDLGFLGESFKALSVGSNLALVASEVSIPEVEMASIRLQEPRAVNRRELAGQSPYVFNADLTYDGRSSGTSASLSYNIVGERLSLVQFGSLPDVYEQPAGSLNFVFSQRITRHLRLKLSAKNLLDPPHEKRVGFETYDLIYERYRSGRSFAVACTWLFE